MAYLGENVKTAATKVIIENLKPHDIGAGLVAVAADGSIVAPYNTDGMFRGWVTDEREFHVASHGEVLRHDPIE